MDPLQLHRRYRNFLQCQELDSPLERNEKCQQTVPELALIFRIVFLVLHSLPRAQCIVIPLPVLFCSC